MGLFLTDRDTELLGIANRTDALGHQAIWAERARGIIPHLTAQTTNVRGFQILVEGLRLWERHEQQRNPHPQAPFVALFEQAVARTVIAWEDQDWTLPGARRVRAGAQQAHHTIGLNATNALFPGGISSQMRIGTWGRYIATCDRANLYEGRLSDAAHTYLQQHPGLSQTGERQLLDLMAGITESISAELPTHGNNALVRDLYDMWVHVPARPLLEQHLLDASDLTRHLADQLAGTDDLDSRTLLTDAVADVPHFADAIRTVIGTEDVLAICDALFVRLCASRGQHIDDVAASLSDTLDLTALRRALDRFAQLRTPRGGAARQRTRRIADRLDTSSYASLVTSILDLHHAAMHERGRADWVWADAAGRLHGEVELDDVDATSLVVGVAWWNDYYLTSLWSLAVQFAELADA